MLLSCWFSHSLQRALRRCHPLPPDGSGMVQKEKNSPSSRLNNHFFSRHRDLCALYRLHIKLRRSISSSLVEVVDITSSESQQCVTRHGPLYPRLSTTHERAYNSSVPCSRLVPPPHCSISPLKLLQLPLTCQYSSGTSPV